MSNDLAYAMFLIHQRQAGDLAQQRRLQELFQSFVDGQISAGEYARNLALTISERALHAR